MENDDLILSEDGKTLIGVKDKSITHVVIPEGVATIGDRAFSWCESLQSIDIPDSVTTIGKKAFSACESLQSIDIPDSVTTIGDYAFNGCESLQSIDIPDSVTTIGKRAFSWCESLQSIDIPNSVTTIGDGAFCDCESLQSIHVAEDNPNYSSIDGVLFSKNKRTIIRMPLGKKIKEFKIPDSVTIIGTSAFSDCESLQSIDISKSVTTIGDWAFSWCESLQSIDIPNSVTTIGDGAFSWCESLQSIHIRHKNIKDYRIHEDAFYEVDFDECTLYIPSGTRWAYRHHPAFEDFKNIVTVREKMVPLHTVSKLVKKVYQYFTNYFKWGTKR